MQEVAVRASVFRSFFNPFRLQRTQLCRQANVGDYGDARHYLCFQEGEQPFTEGNGYGGGCLLC